jgi:hypothetical protein
MDDKDTIRVTVAAVARALGGGWAAAAADGMWDAVLRGPGEVILDVAGFRMRPADPLRMEFRGRFPPTAPSPAPVSITCAAGRGGRVIAADIQARLLPAFTAQLAAVREAVADRARDTAALAVVMAEVARVLGCPPPRDRDGDEDRQVNLYRAGCAHGRVRGRRDGSRLDLDLHGVPAPVALAMLTVLAAAKLPDDEEG